MSLPKRQHFVAQMLQARFTDDDGKLYFFDKRAKDRGVMQTTPTNLFVERHIYSRINKDGTKDPALERFYSGIEGRANQIVDKIVAAARAGSVPSLTTGEKSEWDNFFHHQWKRSPDFHENAWALADFENSLKNAMADFERDFRPLTAEERVFFQSEEGKARMRQNAKVGALLDPGNLVAQVLDSRGLGVVRIGQLNKSFIIGSFPIVKLANPGTPELAHPTTEMWFPISHDIAVTPAGMKGTEQIVIVPDEKHVRAINLAIASQSNAIAGRSRKLIESLANPR